MNLERHLHAYLKKHAKINKIDFYKLECVGRSGFPDVLLTYKGWTLFIELKSPSGTGRLSARQRLMLSGLIKADQETYVIHSKEEADQIIEGLTKRKPRCLHKPII